MSSLLKSNLAVATGTAVSRITGVVRVAVLGAVLGTPGAVADAYDLANGTPNMIYELLIGGVLSSSLVPLFTRLRDEEDDEGRAPWSPSPSSSSRWSRSPPCCWRRSSSTCTRCSCRPRSNADQYRDVGTVLARIFLVQIFFYGLNALATALLNARRRFFAAAWVPVLSNVVIIASLLMVPKVMDGAVPTLQDVLDNSTLRWVLGGGATHGHRRHGGRADSCARRGEGASCGSGPTSSTLRSPR